MRHPTAILSVARSLPMLGISTHCFPHHILHRKTNKHQHIDILVKFEALKPPKYEYGGVAMSGRHSSRSRPCRVYVYRYQRTPVPGFSKRYLQAYILDNLDNLNSIQAQVCPLPVGSSGQSIDKVDR